MRRHLVLLSLIAVVFVGSLQPPSIAAAPPSQDHKSDGATMTTVYDPQDLPECPPELGADCPEDIRFASLRAYTGGTGRRMLAITVEAYEIHGGWVVVESFKLRFDASGGPEADWYVLMALAELPPGHIGWACGRSFGTERYRLVDHGDSLTCFIPERDLQPTKPIRFQVFFRLNRDVYDRAPDQGWAD